MNQRKIVPFFLFLIGLIILFLFKGVPTINDYMGLVWMGLFYVGIFIVGSIFAKRKTDSKTDDDILLAGRTLPLGVAVFTMSATWIGGGYINGTAEVTYSSGLVWAQAPFTY